MASSNQEAVGASPQRRRRVAAKYGARKSRRGKKRGGSLDSLSISA